MTVTNQMRLQRLSRVLPVHGIRKNFAIIAVIAASLIAFASPLHAQDTSWTFRAYGAYLHSTSEGGSANTTSIGIDDPPTEFINSYSADMDQGGGFGVSAEYLIWKQRLGLEFGVLFAQIGTDLSVGIDGGSNGARNAEVSVDSGFEPLFFGLNYHILRPDNWLDVYAGAFYSLVTYSDSQVTVDGSPGRFNVEDDVGFGVILGSDIKFGAKREWRATLGVRYMATQTLFSFEFETPDGGRSVAPVNVEVNPVIVFLGFGYSL